MDIVSLRGPSYVIVTFRFVNVFAAAISAFAVVCIARGNKVQSTF